MRVSIRNSGLLFAALTHATKYDAIHAAEAMSSKHTVAAERLKLPTTAQLVSIAFAVVAVSCCMLLLIRTACRVNTMPLLLTSQRELSPTAIIHFYCTALKLRPHYSSNLFDASSASTSAALQTY